MLKRILPLFLAVIMSSVITYTICNSRYEDRINNLNEQIKELQTKEQEALVIQRVSEQMEDIAFQQKSISDKQRERAEEQSRIADIERDRAKNERALALTAQKKAVSAAEEADRMREVAEGQSKLATQNMIAAQEARAHADTLFYLSLARSLAQTSLAESGNESTELSKLLAYASAFFTQKNQGDLYQQNVFQSLLKASGTTTSKILAKGNARRIKQFTSGNQVTLYGVTDYGEYVKYKDSKEETYHFNSNFRDLVVLKNDLCVAIDLKGTLVKVNFENKETGTAQLESDIWKRLELTADGKTLVAMGQHHVSWIDAQTLSVIASHHFDNEITEIGFEENKLHIFAADGNHFYQLEPTKIEKNNQLNVNNQIVAYFFDTVHGFHLIGTQDGKIQLLNRNGSLIRVLTGHTGPITQVGVMDNLVISTSYDHTMRFWNIADMHAMITPFEMTFEKWPLTFCILPTVKFIAVGQENGYVEKFCLSAVYNMAATRKGLTRDFTQQEWDYYIGPSVPFQKFYE